VLVEHSHFNDPEKAEHLRAFFYRAANQNAIPIVNYNDPISNEETRRMEISTLRESNEAVVECVDNDETAAVVTRLVGAKKLIMLTSTDGIYRNVDDPSTLIEEITGDSVEELFSKIDEVINFCHGASRTGANGAKAKLLYAKKALEEGTTVIIAHARNRLSKILEGKVRCTTIKVN
jgi:glutamate 5-kinase